MTGTDVGEPELELGTTNANTVDVAMPAGTAFEWLSNDLHGEETNTDEALPERRGGQHFHWRWARR